MSSLHFVKFLVNSHELDLGILVNVLPTKNNNKKRLDKRKIQKEML
jgi:hypothetical protein